MKTFAFLFNPVELKHVRDFWPITRLMPDFFVRAFLKNQGFKISPIKAFTSALGQEIQGYFIVSPLLPEQNAELDDELILDKIISASFLARDLGAELLGLGGYASFIADKKPMLYKHLKTSVTSGVNFTAWSVVEALFLAAQAQNIDLKKSTITISGASSSVGSLCARKLADKVKKMIVSSKNADKLEALRQSILQTDHADITIEEDIHRAVSDADIVIAASSENEPVFSIEELKINALVIDACLSKHIAGKSGQRQDITIIEGGIIKLPPQIHTNIHMGLPKDMVYASMAETMLLVLEGKITAPAAQDSGNPEKLEPLADLAVRHGFEVYVPGSP